MNFYENIDFTVDYKVIKECVKLQHLHVGVERENFKIDCRSLFGVGPADIMHVEHNVRLRHVCIRLT